jgi:hypothetical protein
VNAHQLVELAFSLPFRLLGNHLSEVAIGVLTAGGGGTAIIMKKRKRTRSTADTNGDPVAGKNSPLRLLHDMVAHHQSVNALQQLGAQALVSGASIETTFATGEHWKLTPPPAPFQEDETPRRNTQQHSTPKVEPWLPKSGMPQ